MGTTTAKSEMLVRRPPRDLFAAFASERTILEFWLDATTGPLAEGAKVTWTFMVPGAREDLTVTDFVPDEHIGFVWGDGSRVDLRFSAHGTDATRVHVAMSGLDADEAVGATEGFAIVLCDLKTLLETGTSAKLVRDKATLLGEST